MKKLMLLGAVVALAASALPGAAAAGRFTGVVVAKDTARHTVAVVIGKQGHHALQPRQQPVAAVATRILDRNGRDSLTRTASVARRPARFPGRPSS